MAVTAGPSKAEGFRFRRLEKPEEFRQVEELRREIWGAESEVGVPTALQRVLQDNGGFVLGAFADIHLAGATVSLLGWDGATLYQVAHLTVVRPAYRSHHLGLRLMAFQRDEVLRLGLSEIRGLFDPLDGRSAGLILRRLGARADRYLTHYFGQLGDEVNRGLASDRLRWIWPLAEPRVEERVGGRLPSDEAMRARHGAAVAIVETELGEHGLRVPTAVEEPTGASAHLEIPFDLATLREHEPDALRRWRHAVRDGLRAAFDVGYRLDDFSVVSTGHERRSFYFLDPPRAESGPTPSPPSAPSSGA